MRENSRGMKLYKKISTTKNKMDGNILNETHAPISPN
jgi:hypothetical protein